MSPVRSWMNAPLATFCVWALLVQATANAALVDSFEGGDPTWREAGSDAHYQVRAHRRTSDQRHSGQASEYIEVLAGNGSSIDFAHSIQPARVIEDLGVAIWVKASRPGIQLMARVVLPRSIEPRTNRPASVIVRGTIYSQVGNWQRLELTGLPTLVSNQVRLLESQTGTSVDLREAYVDDLRVDVYGGQGVTEVWLDDLELRGAVAPAGFVSVSSRTTSLAQRTPVRSDERAPPRIGFEGSVLSIDGKPEFPRIIEHRGEPLSFLAQLGFNGVWLQRPPGDDLLAEAAAAGLWVICPPPLPRATAGSVSASDSIGPEWDVVLAWDLGSKLTSADTEATMRWAERIRVADHRVRRPLLCQAETDIYALSRQVDVLRLDRRPLGTSLELDEYAAWLRQWPRLARPDTRIWATVQTDSLPAVENQLAALTGLELAGSLVSGDQIRLLVASTLSSGARGLIFSSEHRLDASDATAQMRAQVLELLNLELDLVAPWAAAGTFLTTISDTEEDLTGAVLQTPRARLVVPTWSGDGAQYVAGQSAGSVVSLIVPGASEASRVFEISPAGQHPVRDSRRVTRGVRVTLDEFDTSSLIVLTQDPLTLAHLFREQGANARRAAELQYALSEARLESVARVEGQLANLAPPIPATTAWLSGARAGLDRAGQRLAAGQHEGAYTEARRATRSLRLLERTRWEQATTALGTGVASPTTTSFASLPMHWRHVSPLEAVAARNLLEGGHFEDLGRLQTTGWRHLSYPQDGLTTGVELSPLEPHSGRRCARLKVVPQSEETAACLVEAPPVWITSPEVPVTAGDWVRIQGWIRVPESVTGSIDGLMIFDSLGGIELAARVRQTEQWERFTLYRVAPTSGAASVTFALTGFGEVSIDDVTISIVGRRQAMVPKQARLAGPRRVERLPPVR